MSLDNLNSEAQVAIAKLHQDMGDTNHSVASSALQNYAQALELPLRKAIFDCDIASGIFERMPVAPTSCVEFPVDPVQPGTERDYIAYAIPDCASLPCAMMQGDYVMVPTYLLGNCVEWCTRKARYNNYIAQRSMEAFRAGFVKKINDDAWHLLLAAGLDRNIIVHNAEAAQGLFSKRLLSLMKTIMRRNGGGNSTCLRRGELTDLYMSPEAMDDIFNWNEDQVDDMTRNRIFNSGGLSSIHGVNLHEIDELGANQEYQTYYTSDLGGSMPTGTLELVVGLDLRNRDSFVMPVVGNGLEVFTSLDVKSRRSAVSGHLELGLAALNNQRILLGAI